MARLITLTFPASNPTLFATLISGGAATASIPLAYPLIFPNLARTITLSSLGNNSGTTFTITGTDQFGMSQFENLVGPNAATVTSVLQYHTVTNISTNGAYVNLNIGSGSTGTFQWIKLNNMNVDFQTTIACEITGTINYTVNQTVDALEYSKNISSNIGAGSTLSYFVNTTPVSFPVTAALTGATTNQIFTLSNPTTALQGIVNSSTGGTLTINILQQGLI